MERVRVTIARTVVRLKLGQVPGGGGGGGSLGPDLTAIEALTGTGYAKRTGPDTWTLAVPTVSEVGADIEGAADDALVAANAYTDLALEAKQDLAVVLTAIVNLSPPGVMVRGGFDTVFTRTLVVSGNGLAITNGTGVSADPTFALADDTAAIEALTGTGYARRTGTNTWTLSVPTAADVGALTQATADTLYLGIGALAAHEAASDPHPGYLTESAASTTYVTGPTSVDNRLPRYDGTSGLLLQGALVSVSDLGAVSLDSTTAGSSSIAPSGANFHLILRGNRSAGVSTNDVEIGSTVTRTGGKLLAVMNNATEVASVGFEGLIQASAAARTTGVATAFRSGGVNHTGQTLSTEASHWWAQTYTRTWATGAIAEQREIRLDAPTYAFVGASTITRASTLYVSGPPIAGANATITSSFALLVDSGTSRFEGPVQLENTGLQVLDTDGSHFLSVVPGSNLSAGRTLTLVTGDASRSVSYAGGTGALYYTDASGNLVPLAAGTDGHQLTLASGLPSWAAPSGGGGGSLASGTATLDFGAAPGGNTATAVVTGQGSILSGSLVQALIMADSTADHNADEHQIAPIRLVVGTVVAGTGFTVYASSEWRLTGTFTFRWFWS